MAGQPDPVADVLQAAPPPLRADAWDAFHQSATPEELTQKIQALPLPKEVKAQLWDLKHGAASTVPSPAGISAPLANTGPQPSGWLSESPSPQTALSATGSTSALAIPAARAMAEELATNPNVPRIGASIGRTVGGIAPAVAGASEAGPVGFMAGLAAASRGAWAGGKTGWFSGKLLQNLSAPAAKALSAIEPYAPGMSAISSEGGTLDSINMPNQIASLAKMMKPEAQQQLLAAYRGRPEFIDAIQKAIQ